MTGVIKTVGHELHDPRQAPEERHVYSHERPSSQPSSGGAAYGTSSNRQFAHMPLLRSLARVVQFVTDSFNHTEAAREGGCAHG